jgi:hypothetical protein
VRLARIGDNGGSGLPILSKPLLVHILDNESLTRGLGDPEARILVEWLVEQAEELVQQFSNNEQAQEKVTQLCRRGRAIGKFVRLWCHSHSRGPAGQLVAAERFYWPMPSDSDDPCEVMQTILLWESEHREYW